MITLTTVMIVGTRGGEVEEMGPVDLLPHGMSAPHQGGVGEGEGLDQAGAFMTNALAQSDALMKKAEDMKAALAAGKIADANKAKANEVRVGRPCTPPCTPPPICAVCTCWHQTWQCSVTPANTLNALGASHRAHR